MTEVLLRDAFAAREAPRRPRRYLVVSVLGAVAILAGFAPTAGTFAVLLQLAFVTLPALTGQRPDLMHPGLLLVIGIIVGYTTMVMMAAFTRYRLSLLLTTALALVQLIGSVWSDGSIPGFVLLQSGLLLLGTGLRRLALYLSGRPPAPSMT